MIALIDYKAGNLTSVRKALAAIGAEVFTPDSPGALEHASGIIVPGVGHFGATRALAGGWTEAIRTRVSVGAPILGICLGMQWLFEGSDEAPELPGLGLLSGRCYRLSGRAREGSVKVPHVGWNSLTFLRDVPIVAGVSRQSQVYFTHSFVAPVTADAVAYTEHGDAFAAVVSRSRGIRASPDLPVPGPVLGVQFHPEKSGDVGLRILQNFVRMTDGSETCS